MFRMLILIASILFGSAVGGRTTNKYTSLPGGGFHHHGGFLAGYFNFYRGSRDNPADSFSDKYEDNINFPMQDQYKEYVATHLDATGETISRHF